MSKVLYKGPYGGNYHVFLDDCVVEFCGSAPLADEQEAFASLRSPGYGGYITTAYDVWLRSYTNTEARKS